MKRVKVEIGNEVVCLRSDNGGEYVGKEFETWLLKNGIRHETTVPYTPEQNGVSERLNRTVLESARSMLHFSSLPLELWAEASYCAVYLLNRVATRSVEGKTPYEGRWESNRMFPTSEFLDPRCMCTFQKKKEASLIPRQ